MNFGTVLTAMVTPFDSNLEVDYGQAERIAAHLIETGSDGIVIAGTTGESPTLTKEEKQKLLAVVRKAAGDQATIIMGAGTNNTQTTIEEIRLAAAGGADGVMLVVPYYNKPSQEGLYQHFKQAAKSSDLPLILYNIPGRTAANLQPQTVKKLAKIKQIVGIKEASGSLSQVTEIRRLTPPDFLIYSGDDAMTLPMLAIGGSGVISVAGHIVGNDIQAMIQFWQQGDNDRAMQLHTKLAPVFDAMFIAPNPAAVKYALTRFGFDTNRLRLPMEPLTRQQQKTVDQVLDAYNKEVK